MEHGVLTVFRFSQQMEQYFATICETMEGYGDFEAEALAFKVSICRTPMWIVLVLIKYSPQHERLSVERSMAGSPQDDGASTTGYSVKTSDIARLMEMLQVCHLISHLVLHIDHPVPRVPFSSTGTSRPLMMRICTPN